MHKFIRFTVVGLLMGGSAAQAKDLAYEGKWATEKSLCNVRKNPTGEGVTVISGKTYDSFESKCKIKSVKDFGSLSYRITLACNDEGEMGNSLLNISVGTTDRTFALITWGTQEKDQAEWHRCSK